MTRIISIKGGADACVVAAVTAAVAHAEASDAETRATRPPVPRQSHWVHSTRPRDIPTPLPSHLFNETPWADVGEHTT
ncbi:MAG: hypothetical protein ABFS21_07520 [Actinomycetota bacterium]